MGSASEGSDGGGIPDDCGVGTIVWVRRRNGSWWPGKVIGPEEFTEPHLMSPRSGRPVKLLGREDASVDWYNLEKSKRVKPFRCSEFDACIERAETSHTSPSKKREKYARREDAIIHALELEKQQIETKQESSAISFPPSKNNTIDPLENSSEVHLSSKLPKQKSQPLIHDDCYLDHPLATHMSLEDGIKPKGSLFLSVAGGNSDISDENHTDLLIHGGNNLEFIMDLPVLKRKTLQSGAICDNTAKRRDRRRPLVKVLQNSAKLLPSKSFRANHNSVGNSMHGEEGLVGFSANARKGTTMNPSSDADILFDNSCRSWKHGHADSGIAYMVRQPGCRSNESTQSGWTEENDLDSSATDSELEMIDGKLGPAINRASKLTAESSIESGMSQWHLKGKRNNRSTSKRLHEYADVKNSAGTDKPDAQFSETSLDGEGADGKFDPATADALVREFSPENEVSYDNDEDEDEMYAVLGNEISCNYVDSDDDDPQLISELNRGAVRPPFFTSRAYWEEPDDNFDEFYAPRFGFRMMSMLIDVDLKVQARYRGEHVPLVSLTSKLNGMAIIGHPIRIEVIEDGSADLLLPPDADTSPPPIWKTAKRTSMNRLPRSNPVLLSHSYKSHHRSASGRFHRKSMKTATTFSGQKTRALSSFVSEKNFDTGNVFSGELIKVDQSMPRVTCIPTKVVFSRILESIGRPSAGASRRAVSAGAAERCSS